MEQFSLLLLIQKQIYTCRSSFCECLVTKIKHTTRSYSWLTHLSTHIYVIINYCQICIRLLKYKASFFLLNNGKYVTWFIKINSPLSPKAFLKAEITGICCLYFLKLVRRLNTIKSNKLFIICKHMHKYVLKIYIKLLRHVSVLIHNLQGVYKSC